MSATSEPRLPFDVEAATPFDVAVQPPAKTAGAAPLADAAARDFAVDPARNVVLEASAGTGKTRVLVERYLNLLRAGVDPDNILAMTFTRKAAAEMRERIVARLRESSRHSAADMARWRDLKDRLGDIAISTIDAFCLSLLREFPLEADVDPGFDLADESESRRLVEESLDQALRICRGVARRDDDVGLVFAQLGERRLRTGLGVLLQRRLVAPQALRHYLARGPRDLTASTACQRAAERLHALFTGMRGGLDAFLDDGPIHHPQFALLAADLRRYCADPATLGLDGREGQAAFRAYIDRLRGFFLTQQGRPRDAKFLGTPFNREHCRTDDAWKRHRQAAGQLAPAVADAIGAFRRDLNVVLSRGVWRIFAIVLAQYQRTLETRGLLDFSGVLEKAVRLLKEMDEFAESRFLLESRYRHVLVDEFQDTSRAQWELVAQLVRSWGEGAGAAADALPPSIFIVADRKQSIYGFRDAEVAVLDDAADFVAQLRGPGAEADPRRAISVSFRAAPELLAFVNELFADIDKAADRGDAFRYDERDRFPVERGGPDVLDEGSPVRLLAGDTVRTAAAQTADEIRRLLAEGLVRDRTTGLARAARPADIAILFRSRDSHREYEKALEARGVSTYVYKGLGFFDAPEVQDAVALLRYLANPFSDLRAAAFLRSRLARVSDRAINALAPDLAAALVDEHLRASTVLLDACDPADREALTRLRTALPRWLGNVDRLAPAELLSAVLGETAYEQELAGPAHRQARENLKKLRAIIRRFQNRGYATLARVAEYLEELAVGDESNAAIDAVDAVSLMTVHAAKGLEFPIVFVVNVGRGTGGVRAPIRVASNAAGEPSVAIADYQSEADEDASAREREETKRLLYVALTRARDRLYLSATVQKGACKMGRGSLGEVLPDRYKQLFVSAAAGAKAAAEAGSLKPEA